MGQVFVKNINTYAVMISALVLGSCASSSTLPLAKNVVQIEASAAPVCGAAGARNFALQQAAIETIKRGFERFIIAGAQSSKTLTGFTPTYSHSTGSASVVGGSGYASVYGSSNTTTTGGDPLFSHGQGIVVRMYKKGEPGAGNALSAKEVLGPDWQKKINEKKLTCL